MACSWWASDLMQQRRDAFYAHLAQEEEQARLRRIDNEIHYATLAQEAEKKRRRAAMAKEQA